YNGTGTFVQSGGTNSLTTANFFVGYNTGSGSYNLSASGLLTTGGEYIGYGGRGLFTQSGGTNTMVGGLVVGCNSAAGSYYLSNVSLSAGGEYVGNNPTASASGVFTQSGGTNNAGPTLLLGQYANNVGTYNLNGGLLTLGTSGIVTGVGTGAFNFGG